MAESTISLKARETALRAKGFLTEAEGMMLFEMARWSSQHAPCLEVGSYCGKSTIFLAEGCRLTGRNPLFCIDHHRGSEEQQPGELFYDADLFDDQLQCIDTLPHFRRNINQAGLEEWVIPVIAKSKQIGKYWAKQDLSLVFIDGGHSEEDAFGDYHTWTPHIISGGYLCIHDIFPDPADGGSAPYLVLLHAQESSEWEHVRQVDTLGILRKRNHGQQTNQNR
jgi:MMP 1-O-methyltransferase